MSWLFSQALVEAFSADTCSDGEPFAQLNVMPTPHKFSRRDKTMEPSNLSRFGLTCEVLTEDRGEELLMWYLAGFPARTSAQPVEEQASMEREAAFGRKWPGLLAKYDRSSSTWKTAQCSLLEGSGEFSETWPRWGSMRNGASYLRRIPELPICESESGLLPTPTVIDAGSGRFNTSPGSTNRRPTLALMARKGLWPTPTSDPNGPLSPDWVEWLMGWPIGWTDLSPLETAKFQEWLRQHSISFQTEIEMEPT